MVWTSQLRSHFSLKNMTTVDCSPRFDDEPIIGDEILESPADNVQLDLLAPKYDDYGDTNNFVDVFPLVEQMDDNSIVEQLETTVMDEDSSGDEQTDIPVHWVDI